MRTHPGPRAAAVASVVAVAALCAGAPPAAAKDEVTPLTRYLGTVEIGAAIEHRLLIVHPVLARVPDDPAQRRPTVLLGGVAPPDLVAFGELEKESKSKVDVVSFTEVPAVFLTGDVLRTDTADFAVEKDAVLPGGKPSKTAILRISREIAPDPKAAEAAMLGPVLPSALRYLLLTGTGGPGFREAADRMAQEVHLESPRRSPAELATAEAIGSRVADYRKSFAKLTPPAGGDREIVGCVVIVDGAVASIETFGNAKLFSLSWPRLLTAAAVEAAVEEARTELLTTDLADPADPDRFVSDAKKRVLDVFGARVAESDVREQGRELEWAIHGAAGSALVVADDRIEHFVLITDPAHRNDRPPGEGPDPRAASRKARPTEEEKRLIERRGAGGQPVPPPPPPEPK